MMNLQYMAINDSQIVGHTPLKFIHLAQIMWCYITRRGSVIRYQAYIILLGEGGKEKA